MTSASPGNLGPVTGVWLFFFWGGVKRWEFLGSFGAEGKSPMIISGSPYIICCSWDALSKLMGLGRCKLMGLWKSTTCGATPSQSRSQSASSAQPKLSWKPRPMGGGPSGFPAIFKASQESHIYHRPCCWLVDPVLNTGLLWITSVGMAGAGSCLKCLKFRGGHHGETNKNIQKKTRSVTVLLEKILHPLFS